MKYLIFIFFLIISTQSFTIENTNLINGKKLFLDKNFEGAKTEFEKSIVINPKSSESYLYLSKIFNELKNSKEEEKNLKTTLLLDPKNEEALYLITNFYFKEGDFKEALVKYELFKKICDKCNNLQKIQSLIETLKINEK